MELVEAVLSKVKSSGGLTKIDDLIKVVADNTKHNFKTKDIRELASYYAFNDISFESTQLHGTDYWAQGAAVTSTEQMTNTYLYFQIQSALYLN